MAYKVIILYRLYMPSYFLGTFTEYPLSSEYPVSPERRFFMVLYVSFFRTDKLQKPAMCSV